ncbi:MAG: hypothetical protein ACKVS8_05010 [Phycisphaerales bacterium]
MKNARIGVPLSALAVCVLAGAAQAAPLFFGAETSANISDVYPNGGVTNGVFEFDGGESELGSMVDILATDLDGTGFGPFNRGTAFANALVNPFANNLAIPPTLRGEAYLSGNHSDLEFSGQTPVAATGNTRAGALDVFQYIGAVPTTLTLTYALDARVSGGSFLGNPTFAFARAAVLNDQVGFFDTSIDTLAFESGASLLSSGGVDADGTVIIFDTGGVLAQQTITLPFDVLPGQIFYVCVNLGTSVAGGTNFVDASHTVTGSFDQPELILPLSIPTPGAMALAGVAGLVAVRRRR